MNTQDNTPSARMKPAHIIGIICALTLILTAVILQSEAKPAGTTDVTMVPVSAPDHIRGNPQAPVQIIEYSDLECPFCKEFHVTMSRIFAEYGTTGQVSWVYRHFPLVQLHKQAVPEAIATECVARIAGPDAFWMMIDSIFEITPAGDGLDLAMLPALAQKSGVTDIAAFKTCYEKQETLPIVQEHMKAGSAAGVQGTPFSIVTSPSGNRFTINGAYEYDQVKAIIENALKDTK